MESSEPIVSSYPQPPSWVIRELQAGLVIPAHPLALNAARQLDERRQCALTRYYHAAGAGGLAVAVHTTQFEIRWPQHSLFKPVLALAARTLARCDAAAARQTVRIAGVCGQTPQAVAEARLARDLGYHVALLSLAALSLADDDALICHAEAVAQAMPLMGFYLQPAVGGRVLSSQFWQRFVEIPNVAAIKIAPFNRYQTLEVARAVAESGRASEIALYTGNDDNLVADLLTEFRFAQSEAAVPVHIAGGLLGHWAFWTRPAVGLLEDCKSARREGQIPSGLLTKAAQITDCNAAVFDAAHQFKGCVPGIQEVLRRQGLLETAACLDPEAVLSPGQAEEIDRVCRAYPHLQDNDFVKAHLDGWLNTD